MHKIIQIFILHFFLMFLIACDRPETQENKDLGIDTSLCQFSAGECYQNVADLKVGLLIDPVNTPSEKPLIVTLNSNQAITNISMRIEGRDMFMGVIPVSLSLIKDNAYQGALIFGSCSSNYMVWRVFVSFDYQQRPRTLMFDFLADNEKL
ncbi:hypothetical protein [Shewanella livingstonensis]|uniref:Lipoprotein n=1 Tax=Shewanella livingstonensis TaxID=150120 RepID=A0A3G8LUS8_9GAMM|nr:hypothetical protein [Shewanella livingstonensis]AZG73339.1 hypothetical protein EGC82_11540 [Shewanella livingstonensis]